MKRNYPRRQTLFALPVLISVVFLAGCQTSKEAMFPKNMKSMKQIYEEHFEQRTGRPDRRTTPGGKNGQWEHLESGKASLAGYTRDAENELESRFPILPNPVLVMYVYPHLSQEYRTPVAGYATSFPMYEKIEYALPGEMDE